MKEKEKERQRQVRGPERIYTVLMTAALAVLTFSAAVAVPLLWRGFYYMQIGPLHLVETTPWSYDQIREAYDQMMDFCMWGAPFGTGVLKWSEEGMQHFADCRVLFRLDLRMLAGAAAAVTGLLVLRRKYGIREWRPCGRGPLFWAGVIPACVFAMLALLVRFVNFDKAFVTFHHIFFPGKSNWIFDWNKDQIIQVLPETFFMNCAILIVALILAFSIGLIVIDLHQGRRAGGRG